MCKENVTVGEFFDSLMNLAEFGGIRECLCRFRARVAPRAWKSFCGRKLSFGSVNVIVSGIFEQIPEDCKDCRKIMLAIYTKAVSAGVEISLEDIFSEEKFVKSTTD